MSAFETKLAPVATDGAEQRRLTVSAYVPFYNNAATVLDAVQSVVQQTVTMESIVAIDDGSTDGGGEILETHGFRVIRNGANLGRGATRNRAMIESPAELVLCCDATNKLAQDFVERVVHWFDDAMVAAVFGRLVDPHPVGVANRWRARHLLKGDVEMPVSRGASLATWGALLRRSAVMEVGNFDARLRHSEDADLGGRMRAAGWDIVFDPAASTVCNIANTVPQVLERYWRWYAGKDERVSWGGYLRLMKYAATVMVNADLSDGDFASAGISLACPHYQFWRSFYSCLTRR